MNPLSFDPSEPMPVQQENWTCAACSLAWLNRALAIDIATDEYSAVDYIGNPEHINSTYGLMDASGARLVSCLREQGAPAFSFWPDFDWAYSLASTMPLLIGGVGWYHWVGVRYRESGVLVLANSAPGWMAVNQTLDESDWGALGPFAAVAVPLLHSFPPPQPA